VAAGQITDPVTVARFFHGLSDPSRVGILDQLRGGERRVVDLVAATGLSQPNVSKHLRCLLGCGLVERDRRGREAFYSLVDGLDELLDAADGLIVRVADDVACCELTAQTVQASA
jgi:DNA-binding transcriptional ArsR family regulator